MQKIFFWILVLNLSARAQERNLHDLSMGAHTVGYKTINVYDLSRAPVYTSNFFGQLGSHQNERGRQIVINLWYPAEKSSSSMTWKDYITELGRQSSSNQDAFQKGLAIYLESINQLRNDELSIKELEKLYGLKFDAYKNAPHEKGSFPLLLFPAYKTPSTIIILSEYLASHGYVVASIELKGTESELPEISAQGVQTMTLDLLFAINYLRNTPFIDNNKLAAIGVGINATAAFSLKTIAPDVDALISLEGGILSESEMQFLRRSVFYDAGKINCPSLFIYAPHPSIQPKNVTDLKYADKYFIHFPKMSEFYFLDYGVLDQFINGIIGKPPGDTRKGFELAARFVLQFLNFTIKNNEVERTKLLSPPTDSLSVQHNVTKNYIAALPAVPSLIEMKNLITTKSIVAFHEVYDRAKKAGDIEPFSQQYLIDLYSWLAYKRDADFSKRKVIAETRVAIYPRSSRANFTLANIYFQLNKKEEAIAHYNEALKLLTTDKDFDLTDAVRERIQLVSNENLKKLLQ